MYGPVNRKPKTRVATRPRSVPCLCLYIPLHPCTEEAITLHSTLPHKVIAHTSFLLIVNYPTKHPANTETSILTKQRTKASLVFGHTSNMNHMHTILPCMYSHHLHIKISKYGTTFKYWALCVRVKKSWNSLSFWLV